MATGGDVEFLGPYSVKPQRIEGLESAFTGFINRLLLNECARASMRAYEFRIDYQDFSPDGGVDAEIVNARDTEWIPGGRSAWQFKRGDLKPAECKEEIAGAVFARELINSGAAYRLVIGRRLTAQKINNRRDALLETAINLGILTQEQDERIQVFDANSLALWASEFPALSLSPILGGPVDVSTDFEYWSESDHHRFVWIPNQDREQAIREILEYLRNPETKGLRIQGPGGIGKTRLVMESLRNSEFMPLVVYVKDEIGSILINYLSRDNRAAVLVVDDCNANRHKTMVEGIPTGATLKLITIGQVEEYPFRDPVIPVKRMEDEDIKRLLETNYQEISTEVERVITAYSEGNPEWAIVLSERVKREGITQAADLIHRGDITEFITAMLPEGDDFFVTTVLALLKRVGWDRDLRYQLITLAEFAGRDAKDLEAIRHQLEQQGLIEQQGRYRAISPHPLAVFLAAEAWRRESGRIIDELVPSLDREMTLSLFDRVADLGSYEPARKVLAQLMSSKGPFGTLESIEKNNLGEFMIRLAIIAPDETLMHLHGLLFAESIDSLRSQKRSRRDIVWTLEKLAWHSRSFSRAADCLMRLSLAENETYGNNATGTWVSLFGTVLPTTAASPNERIAYLEERAMSDDPQMRILVANACDRALETHEAALVSAESQEGVLVEPRGGAKTPDEAREYMLRVIDLLSQLIKDKYKDVTDAASEVLINAVHGFLNEPVIGDKLKEALLRLDREAKDRLYREIEHLRGLLQRQGDKAFLKTLDDLALNIKPESDIEQIKVLLQLQPWDLSETEAGHRFIILLQKALKEGKLDNILQLLDEQELDGAWFLGSALATEINRDDSLMVRLAASIDKNPTALAGYLAGLSSLGAETVFDEFLESGDAERLSDKQRLFLTVRGPVTRPAGARVMNLLEGMPVEEGAYGTFIWLKNLDDEEIGQILDSWLNRIDSQASYKAVIDWLNMAFHKREIPHEFKEAIIQLLGDRLLFPDVGNKAYDWSRLAESVLDVGPKTIAVIILDLISKKGLVLIESSNEAQLLMKAAALEQRAIWDEIGKRIEAGDWRISMTVRGWFTGAIDVEVLIKWIGTLEERAKIVADIACTGDEEPTPLTRFLLEKFGEVEGIKESLRFNLVRGAWTGPESSHLGRQIEQFRKWRDSDDEPPAVRSWAKETIEGLVKERERALEHEKERGW